MAQKNKYVQALIDFQKSYRCRLKGHEIKDGLIAVQFSVKDKTWNLFIEDEYDDFELSKPLISLFLVLRSLEDFKESTDFLNWCKDYNLSASESDWLAYYLSLQEIVAEIEVITGPIDSFIPSMDYQLRSGAFAALMECE